MSAPIAFYVQPREDDPTRGHLILQCSHSSSGECHFGLWGRPAVDITWQWNGSIDKPTISPSINCKGGCGRHFTITDGTVR